MSARLSPFATLFLLTIIAFVSPVSAISISVSSGGGGESVSSSDTFDLDDATALRQNINLEAGSIFKLRQADGSGNNSISESINGNDFSLENNIQSSGTFSTSSSVSANTESGILSQDVAGTGSMSVSVSSAEGSREASQAASVYYGALDSVQAIGAGQGGAYAAQGTGMIGEGGNILSGAVGDENVMGATGTFTGAGLMSANLASFASSETGRATSDGAASLDGVTLIDSGSFEAVSSQSLEMGLEGLRDVGDGSVGGFDLSVLNMEQAEKESAAATSTSAAATAGGSYSSYVLTGYRWNQNNPQVQLYLNPNNAPSGLTAVESQTAIAAAANSWDDAVAQNIFADSSTVIIDSTKAVDNPFSSTPISDGYNVHGWASMGGSYLGMCRWWSNGVTKDGYKSILEADTWYASDKAWTTDLSKATGGTFDLQSVAVHELGHTVGLGDLYSLPSTDVRKSDFSQVMNAYDGAQRTLGNGDLTGVQTLYGVPTSWIGLQGVLASDPYIIQDNQGRTHVFVRGSDDSLYDNIDGTWYWMQGVITSEPYAIKDTQGRIHVLVRGNDNALYDKVIDTSTLSHYWVGLGGYLGSGSMKLSAVLDPGQAGRIKIPVRKDTNALYMVDLNTNDNSFTWTWLGGVLSSNPTAIYDGQGRIHTFVRGSDYSLYENIGLNYNWYGLGGVLTSDPEPIKDLANSDYIHTYIRGSDSNLYVNTLNTQTSVSKWIGLGGINTLGTSSSNQVYSASPNPITWTDGLIHVFAVGSNSAIFQNVGSWSPNNAKYSYNWYDEGGVMTSDMSAIVDTEGKLKVAVRGSDNSLYIKTIY